MTNTFNEIADTGLRTWNQCAAFFNLSQDEGKEKAKEYFQSLDKDSRARMLLMYKLIEEKGYEYTKRLVNRGQIDFPVVH